MKLFLLRSAEAAGGKKDAKRKLTSDGLEALKKLADFLPKSELEQIAEIRHSPYVRAARTAKQFRKLAQIKAKVREVPLLEPLADHRILADFIESSGKDLLLVGHQPNLGQLGSYLLARDSEAALLDLCPGGLASMHADALRDKDGVSGYCWQLNWQVNPRMLPSV